MWSLGPRGTKKTVSGGEENFWGRYMALSGEKQRQRGVWKSIHSKTSDVRGHTVQLCRNFGDLESECARPEISRSPRVLEVETTEGLQSELERHCGWREDIGEQVFRAVSSFPPPLARQDA